MNFARVEAVANAVLYEGYMLYPYRPSALKNQLRWMFGVIPPRAQPHAGQPDRSPSLRCELLVVGDASAAIEARLRFLQPGSPDEGASLEAALHEVDMGAVRLGTLVGQPVRQTFLAGRPEAPLEGAVELAAVEIDETTYRLALRVSNLTSREPSEIDGLRDGAARSMVSTQVVVAVSGGQFVELRNPPAPLRAVADACRSDGLWPTLIGDVGVRDTTLCAPIILDDYPRLAPESPGDFFDSTEIDELLTLRILTLTPQEKAEMAAAGDRPAGLLQRTETLGLEPLARLHGALRTPLSEHSVLPGRETVQRGDRVRLRPRGRADIFDMALTGLTATVESLEQDYEGHSYLAVSVDDDPGRDLAALGRPGHRFFFRPDEVELLDGRGE